MAYIFYKYQGTGNDFVLIDDRNLAFPIKNTELIQNLCNRKFGIGADGLILIQNHTEGDFRMFYFNANGHEGSMCGNGGRCVVAFAQKLGIIDKHCSFIAVDGWHEAKILDDTIFLKMQNVDNINKLDNLSYFLDTGSPHYVEFIDNWDDLDVSNIGKKIRFDKRFEPLGTNVNFIKKSDTNKLTIATYERGVEAETLSCGTGAVAAAICFHKKFATKKSSPQNVEIDAKGGKLQVKFIPSKKGYHNIWLSGPAKEVFKGEI